MDNVSIYVITGGTTGIGAATRSLLLESGHEVFNIDYKGGDFQADLSDPAGVSSAIEAVFSRYPDGIDGLISNAGVGPTATPEKIFALNFYAGIEIAEGLRPLLKKKKGSCVMTSSNSITNFTVRMDWVELLTNLRNKERGLSSRPPPATAPPSTRWPAGCGGCRPPGLWMDCGSTRWRRATPPRP